MQFSWSLMLTALGGLLVGSRLVVLGVRVLGRREAAEETASRIGVDLAAALAREPRLRDAAILPVARIPLSSRPTVEVTGRVPSPTARDLALEIVPVAEPRRLA